MGVGGFDGFKALGRQVRAQQRKVAERMNRVKEKRRARPGLPDAPAEEPLACPSCGATFGFGGECPDCHVGLVGQSMAVDAGVAAPTGYSWADLLVLAVGPMLLLVGSFMLMDC